MNATIIINKCDHTKAWSNLQGWVSIDSGDFTKFSENDTQLKPEPVGGEWAHLATGHEGRTTVTVHDPMPLVAPSEQILNEALRDIEKRAYRDAISHGELDPQLLNTPADVDKLYEDPDGDGNIFTASRLTADNLRRNGMHPYWMTFVRRPAHSHKTPNPNPDKSDGRLYLGVGREGVEEAATKNIDYSLGQACISLRSRMQFDQEEFAKFCWENFQIRGISSILEMLMKWNHCINGSQLVIDEAVTKDLALTDIDKVQIEDIPFVSDSMEFFFGDPALPTVLLYKGPLNSICEACDVRPLFDTETAYRDSLNFWIETKSGAGFAFRANETNWNDLLYAENAEIPELKGSIAFTDTEWSKLQPLIILCIKVCVYASIPHHTSAIVGTKKKAFPIGGKPGIANRPVTRSMRVVYLPEIKREHAPSEEGDGKHKFNGRRGYLRHYKHKRFARSGLQNTWQYIAPVPGPNGQIPSQIYKIRKPKIAS
jgi:hypothetical protein